MLLYTGCIDTTEMSITPGRHVIGLLNVNIEQGKIQESGKNLIEWYLADGVFQHTTGGHS